MLTLETLLQLLSYGTIAVFYILAVPSLCTSWKAKKKLNGMLKTESDLELLIACAQRSKFATGILIIVFLFFIVTTAFISFGVYSSREMFSSHFGLVCYTTFPIWIAALIAERPLKKLKTEENAFALEEKYRMALIDWAKPGFNMKRH